MWLEHLLFGACPDFVLFLLTLIANVLQGTFKTTIENDHRCFPSSLFYKMKQFIDKFEKDNEVKKTRSN